jgi:membrane metallo-endopeptidase-like protein 1
LNRTVHNLIIWHLVKELMGVMPDRYQQVLAEFKRSLLGINAHRGLWKTCVDITNKRMGMAVGAMYIQETFNHESKV